MERTLFSRKDLAEKWGVSCQTIINYENEGMLTRNPYFKVPTYYAEEIFKIECFREPNPLSPLERKRLERELEEKDNQMQLLQEKLNKIKAAIA